MSSLDEGRLTWIAADEHQASRSSWGLYDYALTMSELHPVVYEFLVHA